MTVMLQEFKTRTFIMTTRCLFEAFCWALIARRNCKGT